MITAILVGLAIGAVITTAKAGRGALRERRIAVARRRHVARQLKRDGWDVYEPWMITGPRERILIDTERNRILAREQLLSGDVLRELARHPKDAAALRPAYARA